MCCHHGNQSVIRWRDFHVCSLELGTRKSRRNTIWQFLIVSRCITNVPVSNIYLCMFFAGVVLHTEQWVLAASYSVTWCSMSRVLSSQGCLRNWKLFCHMSPRSLLKLKLRFGGTCCPHLQGKKDVKQDTCFHML
jgi:hypothetical protein